MSRHPASARRTARRAVATLLAVTAAGWPATAQEGAPPPAAEAMEVVLVNVEVLEAPAGGGLYTLPLHVLVPSTAIAFLPEAGADRASMSVAIQASNARSGEVVKLAESFRPVQPPPDSQVLDLRVSLGLPAGVHVVAVAVRDELARESSVVATTVAIHDPAAVAAPASDGSQER